MLNHGPRAAQEGRQGFAKQVAAFCAWKAAPSTARAVQCAIADAVRTWAGRGSLLAWRWKGLEVAHMGWVGGGVW